MSEAKLCRRCRVEKPVDAFPLDRRRGKRLSPCRDCRAAVKSRKVEPLHCAWPGCDADSRSVVGLWCLTHEPTTCLCEQPDPSGIGECRSCFRLVLQEPTHEGAGPLTLTGPRHAGGVESSGSPSFEPWPLGSPDGEAPPRSSSDAPPLMDGT